MCILIIVFITGNTYCILWSGLVRHYKKKLMLLWWAVWLRCQGGVAGQFFPVKLYLYTNALLLVHHVFHMNHRAHQFIRNTNECNDMVIQISSVFGEKIWWTAWSLPTSMEQLCNSESLKIIVNPCQKSVSYLTILYQSRVMYPLALAEAIIYTQEPN